jgi:hypothetical protein
MNTILNRIVQLRVPVAIVAALFAFSLSVHGQTWIWTGDAGTTAWSEADNWDQSTAPTLNGIGIVQHVEIGFGTIESGAREVGRNTVGSSQTMSGGSLTITGSHRYGVLTGAEGSGTQSAGSIVSSGLFQLGVQNNTTATYTLSGTGSLEASHIAIASGGAGTVGTLNQSGGSLTANGSSGSFIGHVGTGTYNLSGGTFSRNSAGAVTVGTSSGATGHLNQSGGAITLTGGSGLSVSPTNGGTGTYSISNGSIDAGYLILGEGASGTLNIGPNALINFSGSFTLAGNGTVNFAFGETGVSTMSFGGEGIINPAAEIFIDGSVYLGGPQTFTLITATSFTDTPSISLVNFAQGASYDWDDGGLFTVTVIPEPSVYASLLGVAVLGLVVYLRRRQL